MKNRLSKPGFIVLIMWMLSAAFIGFGLGLMVNHPDTTLASWILVGSALVHLWTMYIIYWSPAGSRFLKL